jgi:hypothetical protein
MDRPNLHIHPLAPLRFLSGAEWRRVAHGCGFAPLLFFYIRKRVVAQTPRNCPPPVAQQWRMAQHTDQQLRRKL